MGKFTGALKHHVLCILVTGYSMMNVLCDVYFVSPDLAFQVIYFILIFIRGFAVKNY